MLRSTIRVAALATIPISFAVLGLVSCSDDPSGPGESFEPFILFYSNRADPAGLYRMNLDGSNVQQLTTGMELFGSVDGTGNLLVYNSNVGNEEIYIRNLTSGSVVRLTDNAASDYRPAISRSGTRIAFVSERDGGDREIWVMNANGTGLLRLTNMEGEDTFPVLSPDGSQIVFTHFTPSQQTWVVSYDGTGLMNLSSNAFNDVTPSFSPDGSKILFSSDRGGNGYDLYIMNPDGSQVERLFELDGDEFHASFTPDGSEVVFYSAVTGGAQIYIARVDGSNVRNLSNNNASETRTATTIPGGS